MMMMMMMVMPIRADAAAAATAASARRSAHAGSDFLALAAMTSNSRNPTTLSPFSLIDPMHMHRSRLLRARRRQKGGVAVEKEPGNRRRPLFDCIFSLYLRYK